MSLRPRPALLVAAVALLCALATGGVVWYRARSVSPAALLSRMPVGNAVVVSIDFAALRHAGVLQKLAGSALPPEPEYQEFVRRTAFDYQRDLDTALIAFAPRAKYFLLRGRFDWNALHRYAEAENGSCRDSVCRMEGSTPERRISFFAVQSDVMALAVSPDSSAALSLSARGAAPELPLPGAPVWISIPPSVLHSREGLPSGTAMFARGLENAEHVTLSIGPDGTRFAARLDVRCRSDQDAAAVAGQLTRTTSLLLDLIRREHKEPNPADLSGVLTSGSFRNQGRRVFGFWPLERAFLDNMLAGGAS